eukprot:CAMPEP_0119042938 /NCGR_PEP_ID=MMETSP1177-20130426/16288_1 /TAXON_ID=2985 /ORGANISM="Ochromonas sp, Strain CCMP1899" /LENGTH=186 /DNA_ID=CAMNT_0007010061 /DNA_START=40 /DNA_END=600 /DNA_ORIENTATION=+
MADTDNPQAENIQTKEIESSENEDENNPQTNAVQPLSESEENELINDADDAEGPTSSVGNIIPLKKLKNGWFALSTYMSEQACIARDKAVELHNSETVQSMKKKTADTVGPVWEKAGTISKPYWDKTVEATTPYVEKTTEQVGKVHENMKPTVEAGWLKISKFTSDSADYIANMADKKKSNENMTV